MLVMYIMIVGGLLSCGVTRDGRKVGEVIAKSSFIGCPILTGYGDDDARPEVVSCCIIACERNF